MASLNFHRLQALLMSSKLDDELTPQSSSHTTETTCLVNRCTAFAFYKPKPMITDLTKGGMGDVARHMSQGSGALPKPVGQLDRCTTGLMIFTCDGLLTEHLNNHVSKSYRVWYLGCTGPNVKPNAELTDVEVQALLAGILLEREQRHVRFDSVELRGGEELKNVELPSGEVIRKFRYCADVSISSGAFHVVKRLFDSVGRSVSALHRLRVSGLVLDDLGLDGPGSFCELSPPQLSLLWGGCDCQAKRDYH